MIAKLKAFWQASVAVAIFSAGLFAQTPTGAITGIVADPTQAPVAGANVIVTNLATAGVVRTQTNSAGSRHATESLVDNNHPKICIVLEPRLFARTLETDSKLLRRRDRSGNKCC